MSALIVVSWSSEKLLNSNDQVEYALQSDYCHSEK